MMTVSSAEDFLILSSIVILFFSFLQEIFGAESQSERHDLGFTFEDAALPLTDTVVHTVGYLQTQVWLKPHVGVTMAWCSVTGCSCLGGGKEFGF